MFNLLLSFDTVCEKTACSFDMGDCDQFCFTLTNCTHEMFLNDVCDEQCNNEYCRWDAEYCGVQNQPSSTISSTISSTMPGSKSPRSTPGSKEAPPPSTMPGSKSPGGKGLNVNEFN